MADHIIDWSPTVRMERIDGSAFPHTMINGEETWNVYRHDGDRWQRMGLMLSEDDARAMCEQLAGGG